MSNGNSRKRPAGGDGAGLTLKDAAARAGVTPATLRRWVRDGLIPSYDGGWTAGAAGHARIVARLRERGHSIADIHSADEEGRLAFGYMEELFPDDGSGYTVKQAAKETGLEPALIERVVSALGLSPAQAESMSERDLQLLRYVETVLSAGLPLVAMLQLVRVYGQAMAQVADELEAVDAVERFVERVEGSLPEGARVIKTIGDEVMIVGSDPGALTGWAVRFQQPGREQPRSRIGVHYGCALYRDGDYYGRDVNIASRVAARASAGEVLVTRPVVEQSAGGLGFERIAEVRLKGFTASTEIFVARTRPDAP